MALVASFRGITIRHGSILPSAFFSSSLNSAVTTCLGSSNIARCLCSLATPKSAALHPQQHHKNGYIQTRHLADANNIKKEVSEYREGKFDTIPDPSNLSHFRSSNTANKDVITTVGEDGTVIKKESPPIGTYALPHPIWTDEQLHSVKITHKEPDGKIDKLAYQTVRLFRGGFDLFSGFKFGKPNEKKWLNRICFLETVAGVPGMVAAMMRHMRSLRRMQRDQGWIHTLLGELIGFLHLDVLWTLCFLPISCLAILTEEAENERMHLLTALQLKHPSVLFRLCVIGSQGVFVTLFGLSYAFSPKFCHRFVGYLEEEAVKTYTKCLEDIDHGSMQHWKTQAAPEVAIRYWKLKPDATMRDVILAIRADEAHHRVVNHSLASLKKDEFNPYKPGE
ncbi:unnamed protein product [Lymnaea stagnalis]|uniref:Alternative oxidase n=1 Tax=Lymnaea stagnalis TaxID=6523 RepID=A0AAV2IDM6_LYMST